MYGQIYLITNRVNGKKYVGQTTRSLAIRWKAHIDKANKGAPWPLCSAIRKYGIEAFDIQPIADAPDHSILNAFEYFYIKYLNTMDRSVGYNRREGGDQPKFGPETRAIFSAQRKGRKLTPEWRKKLSDAHRGKSHVLSPIALENARQRMTGNTLSLGIKRSEETKSKMRKPKSEEHRKNMGNARRGVPIGVSGKNNPFYGKKHSEETLSKLRGRKVSAETKKRMSDARKGTGWRFRKDVSTDKLIALYESGMGTWLIGREVGMTPPAVQARLRAAGVVLRKRNVG